MAAMESLRLALTPFPALVASARKFRLLLHPLFSAITVNLAYFVFWLHHWLSSVAAVFEKNSVLVRMAAPSRIDRQLREVAAALAALLSPQVRVHANLPNFILSIGAIL